MDPSYRNKLGNFWVYREGRREVHGPSFLARVLRSLDRIRGGTASDEEIIEALLTAGELESALADINSRSLMLVQQITDLFADRMVWRDSNSADMIPEIDPSRIDIPERMSVSPPEGFVYYALHPSDFANMARDAATNAGSVAVVGIRSIGTTLSAVVAAANRERRHRTERITVRPGGHPYDRVTQFTPGQLDWISAQIARGADFQVVDEGPGRSGSSFLSVAEPLVAAGVDRSRITLLGSRAVQLGDLCAKNVAERWAQFRFVWPTTQVYQRFKDDYYVGGGEWRIFFEQHSGNWPASWPQMERLKFLSADRRRLYKFEGFGRFGEEVLERATHLAQAGFGPAAESAGDGMLSYSVVQGQHPRTDVVHADLLQRMAEYCAFRARAFTCREETPSVLGEMVRFNLEAEFGDASNFSADALATTTPVLADGRMQAYEWILGNDGRLLKMDGTTHGDDHFFPGPVDIAWDLAGAIVEWELDESATDFLLERFLRASGDDVSRRIAAFVLAYSTFRMAYCGMALSTVVGTPERSRLELAYERYRSFTAGRLKKVPMPARLYSPQTAVQAEQISRSLGDD
jgi:hypothetical protein